MEWLNYHHLQYFWVVATEGSIVRASEKLRLAHPTISGQIHKLEEVLGEKLFARRGRHLVLTEAGHVAFRYADEIFSLGREFIDTLKGRATGRPLRLVVGVADVLPASLVRRFLEPAFRLNQPVRVICRADKSVDELVAELALHRLDVVLADGPAPSGIPVRAFSHPLGECGTSFFAARRLAASMKRKFPRSLDGVPFLLPGAPSTVRRSLEQWLVSRDVRPDHRGRVRRQRAGQVVRRRGHGGLRDAHRHRIRDPAPVGGPRDRPLRRGAPPVLRAIRRRKIKHPAVVAICKSARSDIFGQR